MSTFQIRQAVIHSSLLALIVAGGQTLPAEAALVFDGHEYMLTSAATDWNTAQAEAVSMSGYLVAINSVAEQLFINENILVGQFAQVPLWIGLNDVAVEGNFSTWVNGDPVGFTNWKGGEPNDYPPGENYVTVNWEFSRGTGPRGTWNDTPLAGTTGFTGNTDGPYYGIVERVVPEPSSLIVWSLIGLSFAGIGWHRRRKAG